MAPLTSAQTLLSPAELSYLHSSLSLTPPIRPDSRAPTQFRPLVAETDILPSTNGSARICFADGTEAIVGVKAEVEKTPVRFSGGGQGDGVHLGTGGQDEEMGDVEEEEGGETEDRRPTGRRRVGDNSWVEMMIEIPGFRDDDVMPVFLAAMLNEALLASGVLPERLWINGRFHWKLYIDILLISSPLSYPLPLLSLTTHLALLSTRLPSLKSELDEDPLFDDDWDASTYLYPRSSPTHHAPTSTTDNTRKGKAAGAPEQSEQRQDRPPITLLVMAVGENVIFDPTKEELAVADSILAISVGEDLLPSRPHPSTTIQELGKRKLRNTRLLAIRTIDPPARTTPPGVPDSLNTAAGGSALKSEEEVIRARESGGAGIGMQKGKEVVWVPPRGGMKRGLVRRMIEMVLGEGGVAAEVLDGLEGVDIGEG